MACQSHCHLQSDPLVFDADNSQVFFDDSNGYLVIYKLGVFTVTAVQARHIPAQTIDFIRRGAVLGVRFSLDKRHVCIQRSTTDVDFVSLQDSTEVAYQCRDVGKGNMIHGFVWCNTALCDLCLVTEMGLELLQLSPKLDGVKLVKHEKRAIDWFHYYHPCRALLLCSGKDHSCLQPFQLLPDKLLKFPDFDPAVAIGPGGVRSRLEQHSITLCKLYDKLCCVYVFAMRQELVVYQLGKEAIGKLCTVNLFSACDSFAVSVCDNLLVVHNTDSRITMIFDIWLQQWSSHPVSAPLPLGGPSTQEPVDTECHAAADEHGSPFTADAYVEEWRWAFPNFIIDKKCGKMWSLEVNLEYLCVSSSDKVNLLRCLLKREKGQAHVLELMRTSIREREALYTLYQLMSIVVEGSRQASLPPAPKASKWWFYDPEDAGPGGSTPTAVSAKDLTADSWGRGRAGVGAAIALEQRDIHQEVLVRVWKDGGLEEDYMIAVTTEYLRRSVSVHLAVRQPVWLQRICAYIYICIHICVCVCVCVCVRSICLSIRLSDCVCACLPHYDTCDCSTPGCRCPEDTVSRSR